MPKDHLEPVLRVEHLKVEIPTRRGPLKPLDDITFTIDAGQILGMVGESGAGKSMTGSAVIGLIPSHGAITNGAVFLSGRRIDCLPEKERHALRGSQIGMIFQDPLTSLDPLMTVGDQITETVLAHRPTLTQAQAKNEALRLMQETGIAAAAERFSHWPHQFSGGQRQRLVIALALAGDPKLLIADEPTTALDVTIQAQILDLIRGLNEQMNTSVLFITHDLGVVSELCDTVIVMYTGRIVEKAPVRELFSDPKHPYTVGLMSAIPRITKDRPPLETIEGVVPNPTERISGCSFWPRCPHATEQCKQGEPPVVQLSEERQVRCWLYADAAEKKEG